MSDKTKPEAIALAKNVHRAAYKAGHRISAIYGYAPRGNEHITGLALDFMVSNKAAGDFIANYVWARRARFRLKWQIWRQRIRSSQRASEGWRRLEDRGDATANHMDHPHVFISPGRYRTAARWALIKRRR